VSAPWEDLRPADAPSELALDAYAADEATEAQRVAVEAWVAADPAHQATLDMRRRGFDALPAQPQAMQARIELALEPDNAPRHARKPPLFMRLMAWLPVSALAAVAASAFLFVLWPSPPPSPVGPGSETVLAKGGVRLRVFVERDGQVTEALSGSIFRGGDRLRFLAEGGPEEGHLMVVGAESDGTLFAYAPAAGRASINASDRDAEGALPGAARLDTSAGREDAWLVWCDAPFRLDQLTAAQAGLTTPEGCRVDAFELVKSQ
jgi:hypothetical protein